MAIDMVQYLSLVNTTKKEKPHWRYGQVLFNALYDINPKIANQVRGTASDPFHFDKGEEIGRFFTWLSQYQE